MALLKEISGLSSSIEKRKISLTSNETLIIQHIKKSLIYIFDGIKELNENSFDEYIDDLADVVKLIKEKRFEEAKKLNYNVIQTVKLEIKRDSLLKKRGFLVDLKYANIYREIENICYFLLLVIDKI